MARFLISPGVITREVDNSQYTATNPGLGNIAALVGYAEKGPFGPTLVSGTQDFVKKFGKTLPNAPYLAQAAYKYFEENDNLLVVRAGNDADPLFNGNAAQYSSITVKLNEKTADGSAGYQTFKSTSNVPIGAFSAGATYGFKVLADFRAFKTPKYLESWNGMAVETANTLGADVPATSIFETVFKVAYASSAASTFKANYKRKHSAGSTAEYYGDGSRTGTAFGDRVVTTLYKYRDNDIYEKNESDFITLDARYAANVVGSANRISGYDFSTSGDPAVVRTATFKITIGASQYTITLNALASSATSLVAMINQALTIAVDNNSQTVNLSDQIQAVEFKQTATTSFIQLKKIGGVSNGFSLQAGTGTDALSVFGWTAASYTDANGIVGTWHAGTVINEHDYTFDGILGYNLINTAPSAISFEDYVDVNLTAPSSGQWTLSSIVTAVNAKLANAFPLYNHPKARGTCAISDGKITITSSDIAKSTATTEAESVVVIDNNGTNSLITLLSGVDTPVNGISANVFEECVYTIRAVEKGSYGQKLVLRAEEKKANLGATQVTYHNIYVLLDGYEVSTYQKIDWVNSSSPNFFLTRMANDPYIVIEASDEDDDGVYAQLPSGDWKLGQSELPEGVTTIQAEIINPIIGTNGWVDDPTGGPIESMSADFMNALVKIYNPEVYDFNLVAAPGAADPAVQNAIQNLCDSRKDCFGVIDAAPLGLGLGIKDGISDVTDVTNAVSTVNSSYVGAFWPWLRDYDADNQQYVWLPPSIYALKSMVYTDNVSDPWYAPAGTSRGKVSALDVEYSPTRTDRDLLYGDTNIVNPIVFFVGEGITIWGQKTGQRIKSATDRINVRRLMIYAEKLIAKMARGFLFEPNDSANWAAFTRQANAILEPIRQRRGLYQYTVLCDASTNTSDLVNQNIMAGKIFLQPTKTTEFIEVEFTINAAGDVAVTE